MRHILPLMLMPLSATQQVRSHQSASVQFSTVVPICQLELKICTLLRQRASAVATNAHAYKCSAASPDPLQRFCVIQHGDLICQLEPRISSFHQHHAPAVATNADAFECNAANQGPSLRFVGRGSL